MVNNFVWQFATKVVFGSGAQEQAGAECARLGRKVLLVRDGGDFLEAGGLLAQLRASIGATGLGLAELTGVQPNPVVGKVREGIALLRETGADVILAVGGGSAIDTAKAIAAGARYPGDVWDLFLGKGEVENPPPVGVVLTIAATGSEGSIGAVITNPETREKFDVLHPALRPAFALLNPELTLTLPPFQTACGVTDILSHAMERYFTDTPDVELTDRLGEAVMKTVVNNGLLLRENGRDLAARSQVMWAGTLAHNGLLEGGRAGCWASHAIATELSAHFGVTHGASLSAVIPAWMRYTLPCDPARFARFACKVLDVEYDAARPEVTARRGVERLVEFYRALGMPVTLRELGIPEDAPLEEMARSATRNGPIGCIRRLDARDVLEIYRLAR